MKSKFALTALLLACAVPIGAGAQTERKTSIAVNPLALVFEIFTGEIERALGSSASVGVSASYWDTDDGVFSDVAYFSTDAKFRLYMGERALRGFSVGLVAGYTKLTGTLSRDNGTTTEGATAFTAGAILDYNFVMGRGDKYLAGVGIGAKRLFGVDDVDSGITTVYPTGRLSIGFLF